VHGRETKLQKKMKNACIGRGQQGFFFFEQRNRLKDSEQINRQHGTSPTCQQSPEQAAGIKAFSSKSVKTNLTPETCRS
jgi:hypothetical protein